MGILQTWANEIVKALRQVEEEISPETSITYDYTRLESIAMANHVPLRHLPSLEWWRQLATGIETIVRNTADADEPPALAHMLTENAGDIVQDIVDLPDLITTILKVQGASHERPKSVRDYDTLFQTIQKPAGALHPIEDDNDFAWMMVAGPNPLVIHQVSEDYIFDPKLQKLAHKGNLYASDYSAFAAFPSSTYPNARKYITAPVAYFTIENGALVPVAIDVSNRMFRPADANWGIAKAAVVVADMNWHEIISHLSRTHLFIEPFVVATERNLSASHPIYQILQPHFEGTLFINDLAAKVLVAPGGGVDQIAALTIDAVRAVVVSALQTPFDNFNPEKNFNRRGVEDATNFPDYPYRDDALLIWKAIKQWTRAYVEASYTDDGAVANDEALQAWSVELESDAGGRVRDLGKVQNRESLALVLATIIFTASAQHAAVNFPQAEMIDVTNFPLANYADPMKANDVIETLPPFDQALRQVNLGYLLSSVRLKRLGEYEPGSLPDVSNAALAAFRAELEEAERTIEARNTTRQPYSYLLPSNIPRSINI
jgi:arachidonate 15-lipoxygenase